MSVYLDPSVDDHPQQMPDNGQWTTSVLLTEMVSCVCFYRRNAVRHKHQVTGFPAARNESCVVKVELGTPRESDD